jgi:hypothetical protein
MCLSAQSARDVALASLDPARLLDDWNDPWDRQPKIRVTRGTS